MSTLQAIEDKLPFPFCIQSFLRGLAGAGFIILLIIIWIFIRSGNTLESLRSQLPSRTVLIENTLSPDDSGTKTQDTSSNPAQAQIAPVPSAAQQGLYEIHELGYIPKIKDDGLTPFEAYKRPFTPTAGRPIISLALTDFGLSEKAAQSALKSFPPEITFILSPYADDITRLGMDIKNKGHEFWITLPLQSQDITQSDPGPKTIFTNAGLEQNLQRILWTLSRSAGYAGVASPMNHKFTNADFSENEAMDQLFKRGLGIAEMNPDSLGSAEAAAAFNNYPFVHNDIVLDRSLNSRDIIDQLKLLEAKAFKDGKAVAVFHPYPLTYQLILKWLPTLKAKGIDLAPLSASVSQ